MVDRFRRKKYLVERGLQFRFARMAIIFVFLTTLATGIIVFYTTFMLLGERLSDVYPQGRLIEVYRNVHIAFLINLLIMLPFIFWGAIIFSHRIAGPLPKIYTALRDIGNGNFNVNLVLRKNDELTELAEVINETAGKLKQRETNKSQT